MIPVQPDQSDLGEDHWAWCRSRTRRSTTLRRATIISRCCRSPRTPIRSITRWITTCPTRTASAAASASRGRWSSRRRFSADVAGGSAQGAFQGTAVQKTYSTGINYDRDLLPHPGCRISRRRRALSQRCAAIRLRQNEAQTLGIPGVNIDQWTSGMPCDQYQWRSARRMVGYSASVPWRRAEVNARVCQHLDQDQGQPHHQVRALTTAASATIYYRRRPSTRAAQ